MSQKITAFFKPKSCDLNKRTTDENDDFVKVFFHSKLIYLKFNFITEQKGQTNKFN